MFPNEVNLTKVGSWKWMWEEMTTVNISVEQNILIPVIRRFLGNGLDFFSYIPSVHQCGEIVTQGARLFSSTSYKIMYFITTAFHHWPLSEQKFSVFCEHLGKTDLSNVKKVRKKTSTGSTDFHHPGHVCRGQRPEGVLEKSGPCCLISCASSLHRSFSLVCIPLHFQWSKLSRCLLRMGGELTFKHFLKSSSEARGWHFHCLTFQRESYGVGAVRFSATSGLEIEHRSHYFALNVRRSRQEFR